MLSEKEGHQAAQLRTALALMCLMIPVLLAQQKHAAAAVRRSNCNGIDK